MFVLFVLSVIMPLIFKGFTALCPEPDETWAEHTLLLFLVSLGL